MNQTELADKYTADCPHYRAQLERELEGSGHTVEEYLKELKEQDEADEKRVRYCVNNDCEGTLLRNPGSGAKYECDLCGMGQN